MAVEVNKEKKNKLKLHDMIAFEEKLGHQIVAHYNPAYIMGKTTRYELSEGIWAYLHDFEPKVKWMDPAEERGTIRINYCLSGRCECVYKNRVIYVGARDFVVSHIKNQFDLHQFPFGRYLGYSIVTKEEALNQFLERFFPSSPVTATCLLDRIHQEGPFLMSSHNTKIHELFMDMMNSNQAYMRERAVLKFAELILHLLSDDFKISDYEGQYFSQDLINKIKHIKRRVTADLEHYMKIEEICDIYQMSSKGFTECFKAVYGKTYYAFIKEFRIKKAAEILRTQQCRVSDVAISVGYHNPSKFSKAFSDIMGVSPLNYRKNFYLTDLEQNE